MISSFSFDEIERLSKKLTWNWCALKNDGIESDTSQADRIHRYKLTEMIKAEKPQRKFTIEHIDEFIRLCSFRNDISKGGFTLQSRLLASFNHKTILYLW